MQILLLQEVEEVVADDTELVEFESGGPTCTFQLCCKLNNGCVISSPKNVPCHINVNKQSRAYFRIYFCRIFYDVTVCIF